jgi:hypothetical protein
MPLTHGSTAKGLIGPKRSNTLTTDKNGKNDANAGDMGIDKDAFTPVTQEDFMRVDDLCRTILLSFYEHLQTDGLSAEEATELAKGADYFIRDFVVDFKAFNLFDEHHGIVRQFAGNWYIFNTLEPDIRHLGWHLLGIRAFYRFLQDQRLISPEYLENIEKECADLAYYEGRIKSFWEIDGDGYLAWEAECSLKEGNAVDSEPGTC